MKKFILMAIAMVVISTGFARTDAIIEDMRTSYLLRSANNLVITEFTRMRIVNEEGYSYAVFRDYYNKFRKIKSLQYTIFDNTGRKVKKLNKLDATDIMFNSSYEIADARMVILEPDYRNYPYTVEIEVEIQYDSFLDFPVWMPRNGPNLEVKNASLHFEFFNGFSFRNREFNGVAPPISTAGTSHHMMDWKVENLPALQKELSSKLFYADQPKVHLTPLDFNLDNTTGSFRSWKEFGNWFIDLNRGRDVISDETKNFLAELKKKTASKHELVREIYRYMQGKTRYISIQLGIGGYQTIPSDQVEKTGYGDCKALTNYMKAMLKQVEIPANYVLVNAGEDAVDIMADFPSNQFNHVFLGVPMTRDTIWLECTSQVVPASYIGTFTDDRNVLWVDEGKSTIIRTPMYNAFDNKKVSKATGWISPEGNADLAIDVHQTGAFYGEVMAYKALGKDRTERFNQQKFDYKDYTIKSFSYAAPESKPELDLKYTLKVNGIAKVVAGKLIIPANLLASIENEIGYDVSRKKTEIRRAFTLEDEVEVNIPEDSWVDVTPAPVKESSEFGIVEVKVVAQPNNVIRISRKVTFYKGVYTGERFDRFYEYFRKVKNFEQAKIVVQSKT